MNEIGANVNFKCLSSQKTVKSANVLDVNHAKSKEGRSSAFGKAALVTVLSALAATGIYIATKGKVKSKIALRAGKELPQNSLTSFKLKGNYFKNGKAVLKNGEPYTGEIRNVLKNGDEVVLNYENGLLKTAVRKTSSGAIVSNKEYDYLYRELSREPQHFTERQLSSVKENGVTVFKASDFQDNCFGRPGRIDLRGGRSVRIYNRDANGKPTNFSVLERPTPNKIECYNYNMGENGKLTKNVFSVNKNEYPDWFEMINS